MKFMTISLVLLLTLAANFGQDDFYKGYKVYRLNPNTIQQVDFLVETSRSLEANQLTDEIDFWSEVGRFSLDPQHPILVMVSPRRATDFLASLKAQSIQHHVTIEDLAKAIDEESRLTASDQRAVDLGGMTWTAYHQYHTIEVYLENLRTNFPDIVREKDVIGQSYEGRDMHLLKVGKPRADGGEKPAIWIDANIHAREWISSATVLFILNRLVTEYETNPAAKRMVDEIDWYFLPVVNVDGFVYSHQSSSTRLWRRTRSVVPFNANRGADPNRNYDHKWMVDGANQTPGSDTYAGAYPYSEVENLHVTDAMLARKKQLKAMFSFHCWSQFWLTPWAYAKERPADYAEIFEAGKKSVDALTAVYGTKYLVGTPPDILYAAAGGTLDFAKAKASIKYSYTPELRDEGRYGFVLPPNQILPSGIETFEAIRVMADIIDAEYGKK